MALLGVLGLAACGHAPRPAGEIVSLPAPIFPGTDINSQGLADATMCGARLIAVGDHGRILFSLDAGRSWQKADSPTDEFLAGVAFASDHLHGWAVGRGGTILGTADGGDAWTVQWRSPLAAEFNDIMALDPDRALAVGRHGLLVSTRDGGRSWSYPAVRTGDSHLNRIARGPTGTLYIAGEHALLLRSTDGGETWTRLPPPVAATFYGVLPIGPRALLAYGGDMAGRIFRSDDDGQTWSVTVISAHFIFATVIQCRDGSILIAGASDHWESKNLVSYLRSTDGGRTFAPVDLQPQGLGMVELVETPDNQLVAFGPDGPARLEMASRPR